MDTYRNTRPTIRIAPPEPRSRVVPILMAVLVLAIAAIAGIHYFPGTSVNVAPVRSTAIEEHTTFKSETNVVGASGTQTDLYVAATVRIDNKMRMPIFIDTIDCTLTDKDGGVMTVGAVPTADLTSVQQSFPDLKPLFAMPLLREQTIPRDQAVTGTILLHFPFPKSTWNERRSAVLSIGLYHHDEHLTVTIPKT